MSNDDTTRDTDSQPDKQPTTPVGTQRLQLAVGKMVLATTINPRAGLVVVVPTISHVAE